MSKAEERFDTINKRHGPILPRVECVTQDEDVNKEALPIGIILENVLHRLPTSNPCGRAGVLQVWTDDVALVRWPIGVGYHPVQNREW